SLGIVGGRSLADLSRDWASLLRSLLVGLGGNLCLYSVKPADNLRDLLQSAECHAVGAGEHEGGDDRRPPQGRREQLTDARPAERARRPFGRPLGRFG